MIRYEATLSEIERRVDALRPDWRQKAMAATNRFRQLASYQEPPPSFWSEIKPVFMELQHNKCVYCERRLEGSDCGKIEHDIEHFRPKRGVLDWPSPSQQRRYKALRYDFHTGGAMPDGYYLLAYHLLNYAVACKVCNSIVKKSHFPIAGVRMAGCDDPALHAEEQALLIYPIGNSDSDPMDLITFKGVIPVPKAVNGYDYQRAKVTIDLFNLARREELLRGRSETIRSLWVAISLCEQGDPTNRSYARRVIDQIQYSSSPHSSCARSFYQLYISDRVQAKKCARLALDYLETRT